MKRLLFIVVGIMLAGSVQAVAVHWDGSESTDWSNDDNWTEGAQPTSSDYAYITNATGVVISGGYDAVSSRNYLGATGTGKLTITGSGSTLASGLTFIGSATDQGSALRILDGGLYTGTGTFRIRRGVGLIIDGAGSKVLLNTLTTQNGLSKLHITDGGVMETSGNVQAGYQASAQFSVSGAGSKWISTGGTFYNGYSGAGSCTLDIWDQALIRADAFDNDQGVVQMKTGGQLALLGTAVTMDLDGFLALTKDSTDRKNYYRYWNGVKFAGLNSATQDTDYVIKAGTGSLSGYTVLTVREPPTVFLMGVTSL